MTHYDEQREEEKSKSTINVLLACMNNFERIAAEQVAIEAGNEIPSVQNCVDAIRIATRCNVHRELAKLEMLK